MCPLCVIGINILSTIFDVSGLATAIVFTEKVSYLYLRYDL